MRLFRFVACLLVALPSVAKCDVREYPTKYLRVLIVCGEDVQCDRVPAVITQVNEVYRRDLNVVIVPKYVMKINEHMTGNAWTRLVKWQMVTMPVRQEVKVDATIVFVNPFPNDMVEFEDEQVFGMANDIGSAFSESALCWGKMMPSTKLTARLIAHEVGHLLGGTHTHGYGLMADAIQSIEFADGFSGLSIQEIKQHLAGL